MSIKIIESILPKSKARPMKKLRKQKGVTIHETGNKRVGANSQSHNTYLHVNGGKDKEVSYHYVVDDKEAYHLIPDDEVAWHAGDGGNGTGNNETIAIEICVNSDGDFNKSVDNSAKLAAKILMQQGYEKVIDGTKDKINGNLFQHNTFSSYKKNCPENIRNKGLWPEFVASVDQYLSPTQQRLYRVQVGAYAVKKNAQNMLNSLKDKGFDGFIV